MMFGASIMISSHIMLSEHKFISLIVERMYGKSQTYWHSHIGTLLLTWFNFNTSMDK